jgi:methylphosphotriester-DNA--protein-cysteine methyltransferase
MARATGNHNARAIQALEMHLSGASYRVIAAQLHVSHSTIERDVARMLKITLQAPTDQARALHKARLERLLLAAWTPALAGNLEAIRTAKDLLTSLARLLGLDAPAKIDITAWVRDYAEGLGLDPEEGVRIAEDIIRQGSA